MSRPERFIDGSAHHHARGLQEVVLLAEPDADFADIACETLQPARYDVRRATTPRAAIAMTRAHRVEAAIIDLAIASGQGPFELAATLRRAQPDVSLIFTAPSHQPASRVLACFEAGADDYIEKPFHPREFLARVEVVVRRAVRLREAQRTAQRTPVLRLDRWTGTAWLGDQDLGLTGTEFILLAEIYEARGRPVSYQRLNARLMGLDDVDGHALKSHVSTLRRKIREAGGSPDLIGNGRGDGYYLDLDQLALESRQHEQALDAEVARILAS